MRINQLVCTAFSVLMVMILASGVKAQSMHSLDALAQGATLSNQYQGQTLWFEFEAAGFGLQRASAVRINEHYGITAAHLFQQNGFSFSNFTVGDGSNAITDRGNVRTVTDWGVHSTWDGSWNGDEVDLAWFRWDDALLGSDVTLGTALLGETVTYSGFGRPATPGTGYLPSDGQRRAFQVTADQFGFGSIASPDYMQSDFLPLNIINNPLAGVAVGGTSGAGGFSSSGQLISLAVAQSGAPDYFSSTFGLRLNLYEQWIVEHTVPTPGTFALFATGAAMLNRRRRR